MSIDGLLQIQRYTTKEKNATPFSFAKRIALVKAIPVDGYRASDLVQSYIMILQAAATLELMTMKTFENADKAGTSRELLHTGIADMQSP